MNKKILIAAALLASASAFAKFTTWIGNEGVYRVDTGYDNGSDQSGYWYFYADDADGGKSKVIWPAPLGNGDEGGENALDNVIEACNGVCGDFVLDAGSLNYKPFIGIGVNIAGVDANNKPDAVDATDMGGFCIAYSSSMAAVVEMGLTEARDKAVAFDNAQIALTKSATGKVVEATWADMQQVGWGVDPKNGGIELQGPESAKELASLKFKIQAASGSGDFNIMSLGAYGGGCVLTEGRSGSAIGASVAQSSLKAQLSGRTLSFGKTVASAEIINLQGQVIMSASSVKSMDLSKVQAGVYMVRAAGLSQKIILK